jgi:hypothetical protein
MDCFVATLLAMTEEFSTASFRGDAKASNPESRDSGSGANAPSRNDSFPDCFAEPVIGRRFAPTRWLAMTEKIFEFEIPDRSALRPSGMTGH